MSKLNPQKASSYVGRGVLRKGGKITKVPNGPLVKKKGPYAGSTLKTGGAIKKAQVGDTIYTKKNRVNNVRTNKYVVRLPDGSIEMGKETKTRNPNGKTTTSKNATKSALLGMQYTDDEIRKSMESRKNGGPVKKAQNGEYITKEGKNYISNRKVNTKNGPRYYQATSPDMAFARELSFDRALRVNDSIPKAKLSARAIEMMNQKNGGKVKKAKAGGMIKRADGSYSKRGLWDNIRANKGSGKKPTKQMLVQEKKIKAKAKK